MTDPHDTPAARFDRYLKRTEPTLPDRYRRPGHGARPRQFRWSPGAGFGVMALVLVGYAIARAFGWSP